MGDRTGDDFLSWYVENAIRTESNNFVQIRTRLAHPKTLRILHAAMGLSTEANEIIDAVKKHIFYGKPLDITNLVEEAGDSEWYTAILADTLERSLAEIMRINIEKLRARYPERFKESDALNRDLPNERSILERDP